MTTTIREHPAIPYVAPFVVFLLLLIVGPKLPFGAWEQPLRVVVLAAVLCHFSRGVISLRPMAAGLSIGVGAVVFFVWIAPDTLWPAYREHWLFQNAVTGELKSSFGPELRTGLVALTFRSIRAIILVPIIEELFWRGWLMRWLIATDFRSVPMGAFRPGAFWITALLFASEHGPYWEVGLLAGIAYNWWIVRTKSLADCILAHAVTNALLSAYVVGWGRWEYWM